MPEELEHVLRLVAEGKLTPEEADPIIDALTRAHEAEIEADAELHGREGRRAMREHRRAERIRRRIDRAFGHAEQRIADAGIGAGGRRLRIRITERGRQVVNLHIPVGLVEGALQFVPGLAGDQRDRIRDAVRAGVTGPIVDIEDPDGGGVLITVE